MLKLSIIIPTINRPDDLAKTLECLLVQNLKWFQVVLIDQSDDNRSKSIANFYADQWLCLNYCRLMIKSWAQARNFAINKIDYLDEMSGADTDAVIFIDDDVSFDENFVSNLHTYISHNSYVMWWTWKINSPARTISFVKKLWILMLWWWRNNNQQIVTKVWFNQMFNKQPETEQIVERTSGCGMWFRKSIIDQWYRFPEYFLKYSIMEDLFLSYAIFLDYRGRLTYTPSVEMTHHESPNRSIPNYQKIRQHCIHRYIFHKTFNIRIVWYIWTMILLMALDLLMFRKVSIIREYIKSLLYVYRNRKILNLDNWDYNTFIFDL